jgi:leucyl aminopeptidase
LVSKRLGLEKGSVATPGWMEERIVELFDGKTNVKEIRVIRGKELANLGMNLIYNVGKGAVSEPRAIFIHYEGDSSRSGEVDFGIVGKGVTYDTGGHNIKTTLMELMFVDKGGACSVLGALNGCIELSIKKNIVFACALAENAIGPDAYKPNDVLTAMNGLSVEIGNTDAEGRLVMADTMTYLQRHFKPRRVSYIATLTGACPVALGMQTAGLFSTDDEMLE